jgi:hypothetical protein
MKEKYAIIMLKMLGTMVQTGTAWVTGHNSANWHCLGDQAQWYKLALLG